MNDNEMVVTHDQLDTINNSLAWNMNTVFTYDGSIWVIDQIVGDQIFLITRDPI